MKRHFGFELRATWRDAHGNVLFEQPWTHNELMNEGETNLLDSYLRNQNNPSAFYVRLFADTPVETDSLASLNNEPGGLQGYAPVLIERSAVGWPTLGMSAGDAEIISKTATFRCTSGTWPALTHATLATSSDNTGRFIDATPFSQTHQLASGEQLDINYRPRLS